MLQNEPIYSHDVIVIGAGPGGLGVAASLEGWHPYIENYEHLFNDEMNIILNKYSSNLFRLDPNILISNGIKPISFYRNLHHPFENSIDPSSYILKFKKNKPLDYVIISKDPAGGLWNNVPSNQLTLGPAYWMELAHYPIKKYFDDFGVKKNPEDLAHKDDLINYYKNLSKLLGLSKKIIGDSKVTSISEGKLNRKFRLIVENDLASSVYECDYLVFAIGPKSKQRELNFLGDNFDYGDHKFICTDNYPKDNILIVGGGRSSDWAVTELHNKGKKIHYVMRQSKENHMKLINESLYLPYYQSLFDKLGHKNLKIYYDSEITNFDKKVNVSLFNNKTNIQHQLHIDHLIIEIGGSVDYELLNDISAINFHSKRDNYRFQLNQMTCDQATFESVDIKNLYPGGYLAQGTGLSVLGFHAGSYLISGDIYRKINTLPI